MAIASIVDLAAPSIGGDTWTVDIVDDAVDADVCVTEVADALQARAEFYRRAKVPAEIQGHADETAARARSAAESATALVNAVDSYVASLDLPDFDKAG